MAWACAASAALAAALYLGTLGHDFVYDDTRAVLANEDVRGSSPLWALLGHDFWGTPLQHAGSHGSYRPLTVLSFRLTAAAAGGLAPWAFHLGNVLLHAATAAALAAAARRLAPAAPAGAPAAAGLLFAAHPVHCEAVAGVVGRADVAAGLLALLALLTYARHADGAGDGRCRWALPAALALSMAAMLAKEQGVMALPLCAAYELLYGPGLPLPPPLLLALPAAKLTEAQRRAQRTRVRSLRWLCAAFCAAVAARAAVAGGRVPNFATADNPAAKSDSALARALTFLYLPAFNFWLLLAPATLSFDWSMDAVPLVRSAADPRNLASAAFYSALAWAAVRSARALSAAVPAPGAFVDVNSNHECHGREGSPRKPRAAPVPCCAVEPRRRPAGVVRRPRDGDGARLVLMSLAMMVLPFLPATNIVAYVGFVVAERVLYVPSAGYCLLVGYGLAALRARLAGPGGRPRSRRQAPGPRTAAAATAAALVLLTLLCARTALRCRDWRDEESLYRSGLAVNPPKAYGNLGNVLSLKGRYEEAERCYRMALKHRPNMADVHYNLGILLQGQQRWREAISSYESAIRFRPHLAAAHLNLGLALHREGRPAEARAALRYCSALDGARTKDPRAHELARAACRFQLGRLAMEAGRPRDALHEFQAAVADMPPHYQPQSLYNLLGEAHSRLGHAAEAERWFRAALSSKPDHVPAHLTYGRLLARNASRLQEAERWYRRAETLAPDDPAVFRHYGQFLLGQRRPEEAAPKLLRALELTRPPDAPLYEDAVNAATALRLNGDLAAAEAHYRLAVRLRPQEASGLANLGALLHLQGRLREAQRCYERALQLAPGDAVTEANLRRLRRLQARTD